MRRFAALALAVAGYWLPWLTHPAAALRLNGYELSEWVTFLPGVRDGSLPLSRLVFLIPLACLALLCGLVAAQPASTLAAPPLGAAPRPAPRPPRTGLRAMLPAEAGAAILLVSEELDEIFSLSDRIAVIYEGEIVGEVEDRNAERIGMMMTGGKR